MLSKKFKKTCCFGFIPKEFTMFRDYEIFGPEMWKYEVLSKVKLWYGTPKSGDDSIKNKLVLGIQCVYIDNLTGNKTTTEQHCGDLSKDDIEIKELELKEDDFINKFFLDFDGGITHIKIMTKKGESLEVGTENEETKKTTDINMEKEPHMVQTFFGYFNNYGLRALGCKYISKKDFRIINLMGIFRLRHLFKIDEEAKKKWENKEELNNLNLKMRAVAKLCLLSDKTFSNVIPFCGD